MGFEKLGWVLRLSSNCYASVSAVALVNCHAVKKGFDNFAVILKKITEGITSVFLFSFVVRIRRQLRDRSFLPY
jgi:hypothetical protein